MKNFTILSNKPLMITALTILLIIILGFLGYFLTAKNVGDDSGNKNTSNTTAVTTTIIEKTATPGYQFYKDSKVEFEYPTIATQSKKDDVVSVTHSINYKHNNPCDFKGDNSTLDKLTDMNISITLINKNLKGAIDQNDGNTYLTTNFYEANGLKLSAGYIDSYTLGNYKGYQITSSIEGCGKYTYYVPLSTEWTLVANRAIITEFNSIISSYKTNLAQPGIITPDQEKEYFTHLMTSIVVK